MSSGRTETAPRTCLVTGATGAIGPALIAALTREGHHVRALARHPPGRGVLPADVDVRVGDVTDDRAVEAALAGVSWVFHLAARLHVVNPPPEMRAEYERINVGGTACVVRAAERAGVDRVVFFSTIAVYGPSHGALLSEASPVRPDTIYGVTKVAAEAVVRGARSASGQPIGTILRVAAVYGPRVQGTYRRLLDALARRRFVPVGSGRNRRTLVFEDDVPRAAVAAAEHPAAAGEIFNVTDGQVHELRGIIDAMCAALGRRAPALAVPPPAARTAAWIVDRARRVMGNDRDAAQSAVDKYLEDVAVEGTRIQQRLGFSPRWDLARGWQETVRRLRTGGEV